MIYIYIVYPRADAVTAFLPAAVVRSAPSEIATLGGDWSFQRGIREGQLTCWRIMAAGNAPAAIGGITAGTVPSFRRSAERKVSPGTA